jgi:pyruvate,orthophosphate dikinase
LLIPRKREKALDKILPLQQGDFEQLFEAMEGDPVTIRFLDPPLHEFVPQTEEDIKKLCEIQGKTPRAGQRLSSQDW